MRDTMLFLLLMQGSDPEDFTDDEFSSAIDRSRGYVDSGQIRRFTGNDYVDDMKSGDIVACEAWSGDVINLLGGGPFKWVPPEEGFAIWTDNMLVPNKAEHKTNVETMMNFYYDPVTPRPARRLELLLLPGRGCPGGDRAVRQVRGRTASSSSSTTRPSRPVTCSWRSERRGAATTSGSSTRSWVAEGPR